METFKGLTIDDLAAALEGSAFIVIDNYWFRITCYEIEEQQLYFYDEDSGNEYINHLQELWGDVDDIQIYRLTKSWGTL